MRRTKIVCTLGPTSESREQLLALAAAGMDVARLNFSHGKHAWHGERFRLLRELEAEIGRPLSVLQDLSGPKLRIGEFPAEGIELAPQDGCLLTAGAYQPAKPPRIPVPIPALLAALGQGQRVSMDDGQIELLVVGREGEDVRCEVLHGGLVRPKKGIAAPGAAFEIPSLTEKDFTDLEFGLGLGVDWVAVSFVRRAADLAPVREAIRKAGSDAQIIAKIEKPEAVEAIQEILEAADGLMVARGDLGVEMPLYQVPIIQKELIRRCYECGKPVITATQMLESMTRSPRPTRAEVSDVANAIMDGTSAVMLSGETALGEFPVQAVQTMAAIAEYTESKLDYRQHHRRVIEGRAASITDAISQGVAEVAHDLQVSAILCSTTSGHTARMVSRTRPSMPIIAATANQRTFHRLPLIWGVRPLLVPATTNTDEMLAATVNGALRAGWIQPGQTVVITSGIPVGSPGHTNLIKVQVVPSE
jgi:pyruvate kinase